MGREKSVGQRRAQVHLCIDNPQHANSKREKESNWSQTRSAVFLDHDYKLGREGQIRVFGIRL